MYNKICLMLPTYGRSDTYLPEFIDSAMATSSPDHVCFSFCINKHDDKTKEYLRKKDFRDFQFTITVEDLPSPHLAKYFNMLYEESKWKLSSFCVVSMLGDDMVFRTKEWDLRILDLINAYKGIGVFWCNDDYIAHERCPVNLFVTRKMVEATEAPFMCEKYEADMIDYLWGKVGKYTGTSHYLPDVHIWHNHSTSKPPEQRDPTFQRLAKIQEQAHKIGKPLCRQIAHQIADILNRKIQSGELK